MGGEKESVRRDLYQELLGDGEVYVSGESEYLPV